jgi:hypothetical protein
VVVRVGDGIRPDDVVTVGVTVGVAVLEGVTGGPWFGNSNRGEVKLFIYLVDLVILKSSK